METLKLYRDDPYLTQCEARIIAIADNKIELDQTIFYGEAGGQIGDTGTIGPARVIDAQHEGGETLLRADAPVIQVRTQIVHIADEDAARLSVNDTVRVSIDWQRRYNIMRMHSAAHFVFYYARKLFGPDGANKLYGTLKGCRIGDDNARFDFPAPVKLDQSDIARIEDATNSLIAKNLDINYEPDPIEPDLRYWVCGEVEMYCGGTHVHNTKEIGTVSVKRRSQGKGLERIYLEIV